MMFWNRTVTVYNRSENEQTGEIKWYPHILHNCFVKRTNNTVNVGAVQIGNDETIIRIPAQSGFISPYEWLLLPETAKPSHLTLQAGDIIILGIVNDQINEYASGQRSSDLIAKYKALGSVSVKSVNINTALPNAHYSLRGE